MQAVSANLERKAMVSQDMKDARLLRYISPKEGSLTEAINRASPFYLQLARS